MQESMPPTLPAIVPEVEEPAENMEPAVLRESNEQNGAPVDRAAAATPEASVTPSQSASQVAARVAGNVNVPSTNPTIGPGSRMRGLSQASQLFRKPSKEGSPKAAGDPGAQENKRKLKSRLEDFAATRADKLRDRMRPELDTEALPTMIIPAPARRGAAVRALRGEQANSEQTVNLLAPPALRTQISTTHLSGTTPVDASSLASPRLWRSHSGNMGNHDNSFDADEL